MKWGLTPFFQFNPRNGNRPGRQQLPGFVFLFIVMPIAEMAVLIKVGTMIGVFYTIGLVLLTAVIGAALLKQPPASSPIPSAFCVLFLEHVIGSCIKL